MVCENCDPSTAYPDKLIKVRKDNYDICAYCGGKIQMTLNMAEEIRNAPQSRWDKYFQFICKAVASKSPCLSRHIGAILVRDHSIIATGYNGPAREVTHCGHMRLMTDNALADEFSKHKIKPEQVKDTCPRKLMGYSSGEGMEWCPAQHAEANCIANAARMGVSVLNSTLYMNCIIPCKNCFGMLINAGIVEIVVDNAKPYDIHTQFIIKNSHILIREFGS